MLTVKSFDINWRIILVVILLATSVGGSAQESFKDTVLLREVLVEGRVATQTLPSQVLSGEVLKSIPSSSIADALKYLAGVQIKDYGGLGGQKTVNVRSLGSQHVGVYIDGVRVTNVQNGTVDLGKYSLATLESVSLFNANKNEALMMASEYASASTIYLKTRRPEHRSLVASSSIGSFGTYKATATWQSLSGFIDAAYIKSDGDYPFSYHTEMEDTTGRRKNSDIRTLRIESCMFWKGWQWHTYFYDSERGLPGGVVRRLSDLYTDVGREWDRNFFSQLSFQQKYRLGEEAGEAGVRGIVKYSNDFLHYRSDYDENISVRANNRYRQQDIYAALSASWEKQAWKASLSSDLRWSDVDADLRNFRYVYRLDSKTSLAAFFTSGGLNLSLSGLFTNTTDHTSLQAERNRKFSWSSLASYTLRANSATDEQPLLTFRAFYKEVFRVPTLNDLYYSQVGNRNLKPENTRQVDLGMTFSLPSNSIVGCRFQVDAYCNSIEDRIVCLPLKGSYYWTMLNYGRTRCLGVDCSADVHFRGHGLVFSATFQDDRNRTDRREAAFDDLIAYSPRWSASAVYSFVFSNFSGSLSHIFVDKRYWTAENAIEPPLDAYHCTDLKLGYSFRRLRCLAVEWECQNIFDTRYELVQRWPMPGRRFSFTIKYEL